jgi:hypothetical protein
MNGRIAERRNIMFTRRYIGEPIVPQYFVPLKWYCFDQQEKIFVVWPNRIWWTICEKA